MGGAQGSTQHLPMPSAWAGGTAGSVVTALRALVLKAFQCGVVGGGSLASRTTFVLCCRQERVLMICSCFRRPPAGCIGRGVGALGSLANAFWRAVGH